MTTKPYPAWDLEIFWMVSPKVSDFFVGNSTSMTSTKFHELDGHQPSPCLGLISFWTVSPKVSDFFEGNFTSKTLTKIDDNQTSPSLELRIFLDGLTKSVRLFCEKFYIQHFMSFLYPVLSKTENCSRIFLLWLMNFCMNGL